MMGLKLVLTLALAAGVFLWAQGGAPLGADSHTAIEGRLSNGSPGGQVPEDTQVALTVFDGDTPFLQRSTTPDAQGAFSFPDLPTGPGLRYVVTVEYESVTYQEEAFPKAEESVELVIYERSSDPALLTILDDTIMVTPSEDEAGQMLIRQVVRIRNPGQFTFIPSFGQGGADVMTFLRFSLPVGYQDLNISSDLLGGQVIPIERGVGVTTAVPPGTHALVLAYVVPYEDGDLVFEPLYPFGAQAVRVLLRDDMGNILGPDLTEAQPIAVNENIFRVYQATSIGPGQRITIGFSGLPQPSWTERFWDTIQNQWELSLVIPGVTAMLLLSLLVYAWRLRLLRPEGVNPTAVMQSIQKQPSQIRLLEQIARIDESLAEGEISPQEHRARRQEVKRSLLRRAIRDARNI